MPLKTLKVKETVPSKITIHGVELTLLSRGSTGGEELFYGNETKATSHVTLRISAPGSKLADGSIGSVEFHDLPNGVDLFFEMRPTNLPKGGIDLDLTRFTRGDAAAAFHINRKTRQFEADDTKAYARYWGRHASEIDKASDRAFQLQDEIQELVSKISGILRPDARS